MRILVTGKDGQLGQSLRKVIRAGAKINNGHRSNEFTFVGRQELDLSNKQIKSAIDDVLAEDVF